MFALSGFPQRVEGGLVGFALIPTRLSALSCLRENMKAYRFATDFIIEKIMR